MNEWKPIETAPKDGTVILLTDGQRFTAGAREFRIENDWRYRGYTEQGQIDDTFTERIPNPDAGNRIEWWGLFGCSGFSRDVDVEDENGARYFEPTHWMPNILTFSDNADDIFFDIGYRKMESPNQTKG